jgi:hypothetical protein
MYHTVKNWRVKMKHDFRRTKLPENEKECDYTGCCSCGHFEYPLTGGCVNKGKMWYYRNMYC